MHIDRAKFWLATFIGVLVGVAVSVTLFTNSAAKSDGRIAYVWAGQDDEGHYRKRVYIMASDGHNAQQIETSSCFEPMSYIRASPVEPLLAFVCRTFPDGEDWNICLMDMDGISTDQCDEQITLIDPTQLPSKLSEGLEGQCIASTLSWSPDGRQLAFNCHYSDVGDYTWQRNDFVCISTLDKKLSCWSSDRINGQGGAVELDWSPTQDRFALSLSAKNSAGAFVQNIYLTNLDGQSSSLLTTGHQPQWSPDGQRVAFIGMGICTIKVDALYSTCMSSDSFAYQRERTPFRFPNAVTWSPNGHFLAISAAGYSYEDANDLYTVDVVTGEFDKLQSSMVGSEYVGSFNAPEWIP